MPLVNQLFEPNDVNKILRINYSFVRELILHFTSNGGFFMNSAYLFAYDVFDRNVQVSNEVDKLI